jgi:putative NIF3 family GTP cyclohydrolase 1 type 2
MHAHFSDPRQDKMMDLFLTGEMSHHDLLKACNEYGCAVILTEHSTMERDYFFGRFRDQLASGLSRGGNDFAVFTPEGDADPVQFFRRPQQ